MRINIIKGDRVADNADYRDALPVNLVAVGRKILGAIGYLTSHSGLAAFATGEGVDRGGVWNERFLKHFRVSGQSLISVDKTGSKTVIGGIAGNKQASLAESFNSQAVVADGKMWLYDNSSLTEITDLDLGDPIDVTWIDGYYFLTDGEFIYHTDITDESAIDPIKFATAEFSPDPTLAVHKTPDNQVAVLGRYSIEYFINRATPQFAFQRISGKSLQVGIVGTYAYTEIDGRIFILGSSKSESTSVHVISAGAYTTIATREVDKIIALYNDIQLADVIVETRTEDQDVLMVIHLPGHTLLYNHSIAKITGIESAWSIVKSGIIDDEKWRGINGVFDPRIPSWVYGDSTDSNIGLLDSSIATQYGNKVETIFYSPLITLDGGSIDSIEIDTVPGYQVNPENVTMAFSLTYNGATYGKEYFQLYGQKGDLSTRYILRALGYVGNNVGFKFRCVTSERLNFAGLDVMGG